MDKSWRTFQHNIASHYEDTPSSEEDDDDEVRCKPSIC